VSGSEPVVTARCLRHVYPDRTAVDVCGLDFAVQPAELVALLGPNGCGKTTLLKHVLGMLEPVEGAVRVFGLDPVRDWPRLVPRVGVVLQDVEEQLLGPTVFDDVAFTPRNLRWPREDVTRRVTETLAALELAPLAAKVVHYLSGGEKKLAALAGAVVTSPALLVLDEPLDWLDPPTRGRVVSFLKRLNADAGATVIFATHDLSLTRELATRAYLMKRGGEIVATGPPAEVLARGDLVYSEGITRVGA
jgi:cobalt/nickel transport system ATP-binding protein